MDLRPGFIILGRKGKRIWIEWPLQNMDHLPTRTEAQDHLSTLSVDDDYLDSAIIVEVGDWEPLPNESANLAIVEARILAAMTAIKNAHAPLSATQNLKTADRELESALSQLRLTSARLAEHH